MRETDTVREPLSPQDEEQLFMGALDGSLADRDEMRLKARLSDSAELRARFDTYSRAVSLLKEGTREKAPEGLAGMILRRTRRRRFSRQRTALLQSTQVVLSAEVLVPLLVASLVAAYLMFAAH